VLARKDAFQVSNFVKGLNLVCMCVRVDGASGILSEPKSHILGTLRA
jgi:hypothetical protein